MNTNSKKTLLFMTDGCDSGFGRVGKEIVKRFAETGLYNIVYVGWSMPLTPEIMNYWKKWNVVIEGTQYSTIEDQFGQVTLPRAIQKYQPNVIWTLGDPWMVEHVARAPGFGKAWKWISYVPIDRDKLNSEWLPSLKAPDALVAYSKFGMNVLNSYLPRVKVELIYHGVDTDIFRPIDKAAAKQELGIDPTTFVIGFVGRNQIRKKIPRLMQAFKWWNCERYSSNAEVMIRNVDGTNEAWNAKDYARMKLHMRSEKWNHFRQDPNKFNSALYLHTTQGYTDNNDGLWVGWHIDEYVNRYGLNENPFNKPSRVMLPDQRVMKTTHGLSDEHLNKVYNIIDIHILPSGREGFGLPVLESMSCSVPNIVTNYSSMPELVENGRGIAVDAIDFDDEPFWDAPSALVNVAGIVDGIEQIVGMYKNGEIRSLQQKCRQFALQNDWKFPFKAFQKIVKEMLV